MAERLRSIRSAVGLKSRARRSAFEPALDMPPAVTDVALNPASSPLGRPSGLGRGPIPARFPSTASGFMIALDRPPGRRSALTGAQLLGIEARLTPRRVAWQNLHHWQPYVRATAAESVVADRQQLRSHREAGATRR